MKRSRGDFDAEDKFVETIVTKALAEFRRRRDATEPREDARETQSSDYICSRILSILGDTITDGIFCSEPSEGLLQYDCTFFGPNSIKPNHVEQLYLIRGVICVLITECGGDEPEDAGNVRIKICTDHRAEQLKKYDAASAATDLESRRTAIYKEPTTTSDDPVLPLVLAAGREIRVNFDIDKAREIYKDLPRKVDNVTLSCMSIPILGPIRGDRLARIQRNNEIIVSISIQPFKGNSFNCNIEVPITERSS